MRGKRYNPVTDDATEELTIANVPFIGIGSDFRRPSVNQRGANYFAAWEKHHDSQIDIEGMQIPFSVSVQNDLPDKISIIADGGLHSEPSVAQRDDTVADLNCIVWHEESDANNYDIRWAIYDHYLNHRIGLIASTSLLEYKPSVSWTGLADHKFLVSYGKSDNWAGDWNIYAKTVDWDDGVSAEETITSTSINEGSAEAAVIGPGHVMVAWDTDDGYGYELYCRNWYFYAPDIVSPISAVSFGDVNVGSVLDGTTIIENNGGSPLTINTVLKSSGSSDFSYVGPTYPFTIAAGSSRQVTVRFSPTSAEFKNAVFSVNSDDPDEATVAFNVSGTGSSVPGILTVTPVTGLTSSGVVGGPFTPSNQAYTLQNTGGTSINWTAGKTQTWVTLSSTGVTLAAGATTTVTVAINSNANSLGIGSYSDTVAFTNTTNGNGNTTRTVNLTVNSLPVVPPTAPSFLSATALSSTQISLSWVDNSDNDNGFKVERKTGAGERIPRSRSLGLMARRMRTAGYLRIRPTITG